MLLRLLPTYSLSKTFFFFQTNPQLRLLFLFCCQYCKNVWLGLHDSEVPTADEQQIKDFMIAKYEKKRYVFCPKFLKRLFLRAHGGWDFDLARTA